MNPHRPLGLASAVALVVASMVGTGVFTTSGFLLGDLGSPMRVLAAWLVGGILAAPGAPPAAFLLSEHWPIGTG